MGVRQKKRGHQNWGLFGKDSSAGGNECKYGPRENVIGAVMPFLHENGPIKAKNRPPSQGANGEKRALMNGTRRHQKGGGLGGGPE